MKDLDKDVEQRFDELTNDFFKMIAVENPKTSSRFQKDIKQFLATELAAAKEEGAREMLEVEPHIISTGDRFNKRVAEFMKMGAEQLKRKQLEKLNQLTNPSVKE